MDWQRAKRILLAAFLALDLALLYALRHPAVPELKPSHLSTPAEGQVRQRLGWRPVGTARLRGRAVPELAVRPRPVPAAAVAAILPPAVREGRAGWRSVVDGGTLYAWDGHWAWLTRDGRFVFVAARARPALPDRYPAERAEALARQWLDRHAGPLVDLLPASPAAYDPYRGAYAVRWEQRGADGLPLFDGAVQLVVASGDLVGFDWRVWEWWRPPASRPRQVLPFQRVLDRQLRPGGLLARWSAEGVGGGTANPQLGYRLEPGAGVARLVWRLALAPGRWLDFDAFTGAPVDPAPF